MNCPQCHKEVVQNPAGTKRFCSPKCQRRDRVERDRTARRARNLGHRNLSALAMITTEPPPTPDGLIMEFQAMSDADFDFAWVALVADCMHEYGVIPLSTVLTYTRERYRAMVGRKGNQATLRGLNLERVE